VCVWLTDAILSGRHPGRSDRVRDGNNLRKCGCLLGVGWCQPSERGRERARAGWAVETTLWQTPKLPVLRPSSFFFFLLQALCRAPIDRRWRSGRPAPIHDGGGGMQDGGFTAGIRDAWLLAFRGSCTGLARLVSVRRVRRCRRRRGWPPLTILNSRTTIP
jgi:hypothetical protein